MERRRVMPEDRLRIVRLIEEDRRDPQLVADVFGVSRSSVYEWLRKYREGGTDALHAQTTLGRPAAVTEQQTRQLYTLIRDHEPREFGFGAALWTRSIVGLLVKREFGVQLSQPTVAKILDRLELRVSKRSPHLGDSGFLTEHLDTTIRPRASQVGAKLLFVGTTRLGSNIRSDWHGNDHLISAVDGRGTARFLVSPTRPDTGSMIDFGARLIHDGPTPTYVVLRAHSGCDLETARKFIDATYGRLGAFILRRRDDNSEVVDFWGR
ncbi:helix-turn-helix domain-containing protein [Kutzneria sp. CA-103260]|uniref:helix-turn-helix domain-containing protein n=1 Tax=Kutzneria sp. CA-103260 TaxID=2802641 RepID=UPI001BAC65C8|nr:helix-turn-helix domain-containing protein [Kutzneria sp. CA-103260]